MTNQTLAPPPPHALTPEAAIERMFDHRAVRNGGLFRTSVQAIEDGPGMDRFQAEINRRNFRALENKGHIVVFCNQSPVAILNSQTERR